MKNTYVKPEMQVEEFLANQYVAACGETDSVYKFECNIGNFSALYEETNGVPGLQTSKKNGVNADTKIWSSSFSSRRGCGETHEAKSSSVFASGYTTYNNKTTNVIIWYEGSKTNMDKVHVTTDLDVDSWEIVKS